MLHLSGWYNITNPAYVLLQAFLFLSMLSYIDARQHIFSYKYKFTAIYRLKRNIMAMRGPETTGNDRLM